MTEFREPIETPCISVCVIDETTGLCQGCLRTIAEIASWSRLSNPERRRIMAELPARKQPEAGAMGDMKHEET